MTETKAGRELLHRLRKDGVLPLQRDAYIDAIEREAAQQERERIRLRAMAAGLLWRESAAELDAILAEPSE